MTTAIPMNMKILNIICAVQSVHKLFVNEQHLLDDGIAVGDTVYREPVGVNGGALKRTQAYFEDIDADAIHQLGLKQNHYCFDAIIRYDVTKEILNTSAAELNRYEFRY